jgi:hypothetical protein
MIKGDGQISEPALNMPPIQLGNSTNTTFSPEEIKPEISMKEGIAVQSEVRPIFDRLKRRMRSRSSTIL